MSLPFFSVRYVFLFLLLIITPVYALEKLSFTIEKIVAKDWQLNDVGLSVFNLHDQSQQFSASIKQISLPEPFSNIKFFDIQCLLFSWQEGEIICQQGKATLKSKLFHASPFQFSFFVSDKHTDFRIKNLIFAQGRLSLTAKEKGGHWLVTIKSYGMQLKSLTSLLSSLEMDIDEVNSGIIDTDINYTAKPNGANQIRINTQFSNVSIQAQKGEKATEALNFKMNLTANLSQGVWQWESKNQIQQGELYLEPVYLEIKETGISLTAKGKLENEGEIIVQQATLSQSDVVEIKANGIIQYKQGIIIDKTDVSGHIQDVEQFLDLYVLPFTDGSTFAGFKLTGQLRSEFQLQQSTINKWVVDFENLNLADDKDRIVIEGLGGQLNWSENHENTEPSRLHWIKLAIKSIPLESGKLKFFLGNKKIKLLQASSIPVLGGMLDIKQFKWQITKKDEPKVFFKGEMRRLSLEKLSKALDWTPLSGTISGNIPGVNYENKTLTVEGGIKVNVFDGIVKINKLASSGLFTDFAKFYLDMEIDYLDLHQLTQKFQVGGMEGRLSGFINDLYLENWKPVTFYAWLGTPENDDSRHRISQKAVENIASIGGGGAADIISKGFLRFFDTFGYDRLGFGCYLHQGVCQMMGVEAAGRGYYIIKGGGLPRIDVIGFNSQLDWNVLVQRLSRITTSDEIVIE